MARNTGNKCTDYIGRENNYIEITHYTSLLQPSAPHPPTPPPPFRAPGPIRTKKITTPEVKVLILRSCNVR